MKHSRRKTKLSKKRFAKIITVLIVIAVTVTALVFILRDKVAEEYSIKEESRVQQGRVTVGSISTSVYGSGMLSDVDVEKVEIPSGVELEKLYVQAGDLIEEGALMATVDVNSAMAAMVELSEEISSLDSQINTASVKTIDNLISSSINGRVKAIFVEKGDDIADVMMEKGALMLLSLDGYMAVDIPAGTLSEKESVSVVTLLGRYTGTVDKVIGDTATVLITDNGTSYQEEVTVEDWQGNVLGSGSLYIHDPLKIIGYTGTVNYIWAKENTYVYSGSSLLELVNQSYTVELDALLVERHELEDKLGELISIYRQGAIYAPFSGTVKEVNATDKETAESDESTMAGEADPEAAQYISISPDKTMSVSVSVDESDILSVSVGQEASVSINSLNGQEFTGTVTEIDRIGTSSSGVTVYTATVSIEKESGMLAGMSATTTIAIEGVENALLIPVDALNKTSSSYYVYTSYDEETNTLGGMKEVTAGISNADFVEVTGGLSEGDVIYYEERDDWMSFFMPGGMGGAMPGRANVSVSVGTSGNRRSGGMGGR